MERYIKYINVIFAIGFLFGLSLFLNGNYMYKKASLMESELSNGVLEEYQEDPQAIFKLASLNAESGAVDSAIKLYIRVINMSEDNPKLQSLAFYNIGNIRFRKALLINGRDMTVRDETEYLFNQARDAYRDSLRKNPDDWGARHNLDRLNTIIKEVPPPGQTDAGFAGMIQGNIPPGGP